MNKPHDPNGPSRTDFQQALQSMDTYTDITVDDLMTLAQRAEQFASRRKTSAIGVSQVMSQPVRTVHPQTPLAEAAHLMVTERISGLPVVDDADALVGIITEADFLRALGVPAHQPHHNLWQTLESLFSHLTHHGELETPNAPVTEHMVKHVVCVQPEQDLHDVIDVMKRNSVKRVVVCDEKRQVLGMITRSDLVRVFFDRYTQPRQT
jgi:CBS-domain-containing membrane protein